MPSYTRHTIFSVVELTQIPSRQYHRTARYKGTQTETINAYNRSARIINRFHRLFYTRIIIIAKFMEIKKFKRNWFSIPLTFLQRLLVFHHSSFLLQPLSLSHLLVDSSHFSQSRGYFPREDTSQMTLDHQPRYACCTFSVASLIRLYSIRTENNNF